MMTVGCEYDCDLFVGWTHVVFHQHDVLLVIILLIYVYLMCVCYRLISWQHDLCPLC
jgi:hypothetical protein